MKSAIIMFADSPSFYTLAGEINAFLAQNEIALNDVELWLFYHDEKPSMVPELTQPISQVLLIKANSRYLPEVFLDQLQQIQKIRNIDLFLFNGDSLGNELSTRLAFRLKGSSCLNIEQIALTPQSITVNKPVYGNNLNASFLLSHSPYCLSIPRRSAAPANAITLSKPYEEYSELTSIQTGWVDNVTCVHLDHNEQAGSAKIVLAVGRGVTPAIIRQCQDIAKTLGAYFGGSRPVIMNGWLTVDKMIGVSGVRLSPELCIVAGASGAAAFVAGIRDSKFIIAINHDDSAPIFNIADIAIVDELEPVLTELEQLIKAT